MKLSKKEIKFLSTSFQAQTPISIFANINDLPDGSEYQSLVNKGVIAGNAYSPKALNLLLMLTKPQRCSRFILQNSFFVVEKYTYRVDDTLILAQNNEGELDFEILSDTSELSIKLSEVFGMSKITTSEISEIFTPGELIVLLAMIDVTRRNALLSYANASNNQDAKSYLFTVDSVNNELSLGYKNGLVEIFTKNYKQTIPPSAHTNTLLDSLVKKGVVVMNGGYILSSNYEMFAQNFLIPESIAMYESFDLLPSGEAAAIARLAVTAGLHEIVTFLFDGEVVEVKTVSAAQLLSNIEDFMSCPEIKSVEISAVTPITPPVPVAPPLTTYQQTQPTKSSQVNTFTNTNAAPINTNAAPINTNEWTCQCGRVNSGGNFCASCGSKKP